MPNRKFGGKELVDAEQPLMIPLLKVDIDSADALRSAGVNDPKRFTDCVMAQACKRVFGESAVVRFNRTNAYVAWDGAKYALRYEYSDTARLLMETFDKEESIEPGDTIVLNPPSPRRRLDSMRRYWENTEKHRKDGTTRRTGRRQRSSDSIDLTLRNGIFARKS